MARAGVSVSVACAAAVVGRPTTVEAVVVAERAVTLTAVALSFQGRFWGQSAVPVVSTISASRDKELWGVATLVDITSPVALAAGERRRFTATFPGARWPTMPDRGARRLRTLHEIDAAVTTPDTFRPVQASAVVDVLAPAGRHPDLTGVAPPGSEPQLQATASVQAGEVLRARARPGAEVALVRTERAHWAFSVFGRTRRVAASATADGEGRVALVVPPDAAPTLRHRLGELRWTVEASAGGSTSVADVDVFQVP